MFETRMTVVGTVTSDVKFLRTRKGNVPLASFHLGSTARTFNRDKAQWVDGNSLYLRVVCWRRLGENVAASVRRGDPVLVAGNLSSHSYQGKDGVRRWAYEIDAASVGPDLSRGTAAFERVPFGTPGYALPDEDDRVEGFVLSLGSALMPLDEDVSTPSVTPVELDRPRPVPVGRDATATPAGTDQPADGEPVADAA
jgi:single-strand DNA-binding protein